MAGGDAGAAPGAGSLAWTDNHCHLPEAPDDRAATVAAAQAAGVARMITVGCDVASSRACLAAARASTGVWATAGVHPHDASSVIDEAGALDLAPIVELLAAPEVVGVGECGLDFHYDHSPRDQQRRVFEAQIALAHEHDLALVIHTREAWDDTFAILRDTGVPPRTVFHCFTGGPDEAARGLELGIHLSFSGIVTYKTAPELRAAAAICPLDRLLVETDSPYLAPVPLRGKKNSPGNVVLVGEAVAAAKGIPAEAVADASWQNAERLYQLR
jgi:TatD DNase family protein